MLTAGQITFLTISVGPIFATILWFIARNICGTWMIPHAVVVGLVGNAITIVPIGCLLYNIFIYQFSQSWFPTDAPAPTFMNIAGNEVTIFLALLYAALTLVYASTKSIHDSKKSLAAGA